ncbi:MAG TPA: PA14 domain-containing protein, partial [Acidimicrobiales bacterium]
SLCEVDYWDGTSTKLWYNSGGQLARIEDPGNPGDASAANLPAKTDFAYNAAGLLSAVRTPLLNDAMAAGAITGVPTDANDDRTRTRIDYVPASAQVSKVTLPTPNAGALLEAARPAHSYDLTVANQASVHTDYPQGQAASFEPAGFSRRVAFPARAADGTLTLTDTNANGNSATTLLDAANHPLSSTDTAGRKSTVVYAIDAARSHPVGQPTDSYGAAPAACFGTDRKAMVPPCASPPSHTATTYDTAADGITTTQGLAVTYWSNLNFAGLPARHSTVAPTAGNMVPVDPPAEGLTVGVWSARFTGEVVFPASGAYTFTLAATGSARLYIDDAMVVGPGANGTFVQAAGPATRRRIRIDYAPPVGAAAQLSLRWTQPGAADQALPASQLAPRYLNVTKAVTDDNNWVPAKTTTTNTEGPTGLIKAVTTDPAGLNLTTSVTYEDVGDGKYRRPTLKTLPAGDTADATTGTSSQYYAGVTHPPGQTVPAATGEANSCAANSTTVNQGAALHVTTSATPNASTLPIITKSVYDAAGRVVATRRNTDPWTCTTYDARGRLLSISIPGLTDPAFGATALAPRTVTS